MKSQALKAEMQEHFRHLQTAANTLLQIYRDENRANRNAPNPAHFDTTWAYRVPGLEGTSVQVPEPGSLVAAADLALGQASERREDLHGAYRTAMDQYKRITDLVGDEKP
jgi:hypothetical protein